MSSRLTRRAALLSGAAALSTPYLALAEVPEPVIRGGEGVRRNTSTFRSQRWEDHFETLGTGAILADISSRALHFWDADGETYRLYPSSVPMTEDLTRRGYTKITRKRVGPDWTPTANMRERDPSLPAYMPPGPGNPLGTHALYLTWPAYLIHGTHDTRKIGRQSSSGCIGLFNGHIEELHTMVKTGMQVRLV
jgi:L,D-transpeptidase ErfK/SrfK